MATDLVAAIQKVHISSQDHCLEGDEPIDAFLNEPHHPKCVKRTLEDVKNELENEFLKPSTSFSTEWLNKFQVWVETVH